MGSEYMSEIKLAQEKEKQVDFPTSVFSAEE